MEEILAVVKTYDIPELRKKLIENGVDVGPIYSTSISLFQRRLAKRLFELQGGKLEEENDDAKKPTVDSATKEKSQTRSADSPCKLSDVFYAICLPESIDPELKEEVSQLVFSDKELALKTAKKIKNSRFKIFALEKDAHDFTKLTAESAFNSPRKPQLKPEDSKDKEKPVTSESSPYKSPRTQEISVLRKSIENGNVEFFRKIVWENPRYLVGSGDTPVIYQEGFRYTAMHVAALKNKPEACRIILDTIENPEFVRQLYCQSKHTVETQNGIINFLVDMYLNMGDRGNCESPLHMACKFGHDEVVEILISHPKTDRKLVNKYGNSPKDIICSRCPNASAAIKERIEMLLEGQSYVPLWRSEDNSTTAVISQPWSPDRNSSLQKEDKTWSPKDPTMSVKAYAGPMSPSNARNFHKRWTTPPTQSPDDAKKYFDMKRGDSEKGLERIGRQLAHEMKIPWLEYWEFLNAYVDLSYDNGLELLEKYFEKMVWLEYVKAFKDKNNINENLCDFLTPVKRGKPDYRLEDHSEIVSENNNNLPGSESKLNEVVSPMTNLAHQFAKIELLDESWSDKATVYSSDKSTADDKSDVDKNIKEHSETNDNLTVASNKPDEKSMGERKILNNSSNTEQIKDNSKERSTDSVDGTNQSSVHTTMERIVKESNINDAGRSSVDDVRESSEDAAKRTDSAIGSNIDGAKETNVDTPKEISSDDTKESVDCAKGSSVDAAKERSLDAEKDNPESFTESTVESPDIKADEAIKKDANGDLALEGNQAEPLIKKTDLLKQRSYSSDSTDSFKTTTEDIEDVAEFHDLEETEQRACINVSESSVDQLKEYLKKHKHEAENSNTNANFVVRLKPTSDKSGMKVDIISIPDADVVTCNDLFVLEDICVSACEGDIGGAKEGEMVEVGTGASKTDLSVNEPPVTAYLSRSVTLPKVAYLHGPQPTREDLDVSRALGDIVIVPDLYPNVFRWKIRLSRFLKDTNYRWQSPAKVRTKQQQGSPRPSPLHKTSPVIQYGSPLGLQSQHRMTTTTDIRTRLFSSIAE